MAGEKDSDIAERVDIPGHGAVRQSAITSLKTGDK